MFATRTFQDSLSHRQFLKRKAVAEQTSKSSKYPKSSPTTTANMSVSVDAGQAYSQVFGFADSCRDWAQMVEDESMEIAEDGSKRTEQEVQTREEESKKRDLPLERTEDTLNGGEDDTQSKGANLTDYDRVNWTDLVQQEFYRRALVVDCNGVENIHHFNWKGEPIDGPSNTDPEVSLFAIMSEPKVVLKESSGATWKRLVIANAMKYVDPVYVWLDEQMYNPVFETPQALIQYARGRTVKFYTGHGHWASGNLERDMIVEDTGDTNIYLHKDLAIGNGFIDRHVVISFHERSRWLRELKVNKPRPNSKRRLGVKSLKERWPSPGPSRFSQCLTADEL